MDYKNEWDEAREYWSKKQKSRLIFIPAFLKTMLAGVFYERTEGKIPFKPFFEKLATRWKYWDTLLLYLISFFEKLHSDTSLKFNKKLIKIHL